MERELPPYRAAVTKPERASIWPTIAITAVLLAVAGCGVYLIGQTNARWEKNRTDKAARIAEFERRWAAQQAGNVSLPSEKPSPEVQQLLDNIERERTRPQKLPDGLRCINGQLFRKLPNGWENIPGQRC